MDLGRRTWMEQPSSVLQLGVHVYCSSKNALILGKLELNPQQWKSTSVCALTTELQYLYTIYMSMHTVFSLCFSVSTMFPLCEGFWKGGKGLQGCQKETQKVSESKKEINLQVSYNNWNTLHKLYLTTFVYGNLEGITNCRTNIVALHQLWWETEYEGHICCYSTQTGL